MALDKDTTLPTKLMIRTTYGPVLERTLLTFILQDLVEIMSSMKVAPVKDISVEKMLQARHEALLSPQVKRSLIARLNALKYLRSKIVDEVLKQYNLRLPNDEISFYHDVMEEYLEAKETQIENWIRAGQYHQLHDQLNRLTVH